MQRVVIMGSAGSGKSTLAAALGANLALPVVHLDQLHWLPGWKLRPKLAAYELVAERAREPAWVMEGNWSHSLDVRLRRCDTFVFIDLPRSLCVARVLRRIATSYGRVRSDMAPGCPEQFDPSFLKWIWDYPKRDRGQTLQLLKDAPNAVACHHLRSPSEVAGFLRSATP